MVAWQAESSVHDEYDKWKSKNLMHEGFVCVVITSDEKKIRPKKASVF
jgi:hypothetical protein